MAGMLSGNNFSAKLNYAFTFVPSHVIICKENRLDIFEFTPREKNKTKTTYSVRYIVSPVSSVMDFHSFLNKILVFFSDFLLIKKTSYFFISI